MAAQPHPFLAPHMLSERQLLDRISREYITTHIQEFNSLVEGFPKGAITEITGYASSGRTTLLQSALSAASNAGEFCVLVDACDSFDPHSAAASGVDLSRLLWVRCAGNPERALKAADMLVHAGGWGMIALDLASIPSQHVRRIPISWWYRFRRAVENTPAAFLVLETEPFVRSCASLAVELRPSRPSWEGQHPDFRVLHAATVEVKSRKPVRSQPARFSARALA